MTIKISPYLGEHEPLVGALNGRLARGGSEWTLFEKAIPEWLPPGLSQNSWREIFVAIEDSAQVRGGYCLRAQRFLLNGEPVTASSLQGPVSEGIIDKRYASLAFHMLRDMEQRTANLYGWGPSERILALLVKLGWKEFRAPFLIRVFKANRFLRSIPALRTTRARRVALDVLAATGVGAVSIKILQWRQTLGKGGARIRAPRVVVCPRFGAWADEVWDAGRGGYAFVGLRDQDTMNALVPVAGWPGGTILRMDEGGHVIGWAVVRDTQFKDSPRFGSLRVGSLIDSFAHPGEEYKVVDAATGWLQSQGVDVVATNYVHPTWLAAFERAGYLARKAQRAFLVSPGLARTLGDTDRVFAGTYITPLDGDGPHGL